MLSSGISKKEKKPKSPPPAWFLQPPASRPTPSKWFSERPRGLYTKNDAISDATHTKLLSYFDKVQWVQRWGTQYPGTAHYNYLHTSIDATDPAEIQTEFEAKYPELYAAAYETFHSMKSVVPAGTHQAFDSFAPETVSVHKHEPNWGLGKHYDNSHAEGAGLVLMLNVVKEDQTKTEQVHREFRFTDPPGGRKFGVFTPGKMGLVFTGNAYDFWMHESIRNKKQTVINYSITIRLKCVCGHGKKASDGLTYKPGPGPAEKTAHERIAAMREAGIDY
jgi:hypothetical protein